MPVKKANKARRVTLYFLGFIIASSVALISYIQSSFLEKHISLSWISLFFVISNFITLITIANFPNIIHKLGNYFTSKNILILLGASLLSLAATSGPISATVSLMLFIITSNLIWINIDIYLEEVSDDKDTGKIRTIYLTFYNLGWIIGPIISANLIEKGGYSLPFLLAALLLIPVFLVIEKQKNNLKDKTKKTKEKIIVSFLKIWKNQNLKGVFIAATALNIFFSGVVLYIPIYLHQTLGIDWANLGWMFSFMLLPFVIFEIPVGLMADKYLGEKEIMLLGLLIIFASSLLFFYIKTPAVILWAITLFFSRVGAAMVEATRDSYFFKNVSAKDLGLINVFRMTGPLGYVIGAAFGALSILFLPINYVFLVLAIILIPAFFSISFITDTK
ncbi:MFS transporter [Candidatus Falkowbacteria bacterium]|nr:MFS transporter [Candidatus Falkowbacteria bacterium]